MVAHPFFRTRVIVVPGRGGLDGSNALGKLRIALGLIHADQG
jgi:hypothetical protein